MNLTIYYLEQVLALAKEHKLKFKNLTKLCEFCAAYISGQRNESPPISITTLTRNALYRAMIDQYLENMTDSDSHILIRQLQLANSNLRHDIKRVTAYARSLEENQIRPSLEHSTDVSPVIDLEKSSLIKTIDLLLSYFTEHVEIDSKTLAIVCPYLKSKDRIVVPSEWAKPYLLLKSNQRDASQ